MIATTPLPPPTASDLRCTCGQLVARWRGETLEIKCKRCRRIVCIPLQNIGGTPPQLMT